MTVNRKVTGTAMTMPAGIGVGCGISMLVTILGSALVAKLISLEVLQEMAIGYGAMAIILVASTLGALTAVKKVKKRMLQVSALVGFVYYGLLLAMTACLFGGQYQGLGVTALLVLAGCGLVALILSREQKPKRFRKLGRCR